MKGEIHLFRWAAVRVIACEGRLQPQLLANSFKRRHLLIGYYSGKGQRPITAQRHRLLCRFYCRQHLELQRHR